MRFLIILIMLSFSLNSFGAQKKSVKGNVQADTALLVRDVSGTQPTGGIINIPLLGLAFGPSTDTFFRIKDSTKYSLWHIPNIANDNFLEMEMDAENGYIRMGSDGVDYFLISRDAGTFTIHDPVSGGVRMDVAGGLLYGDSGINSDWLQNKFYKTDGSTVTQLDLTDPANLLFGDPTDTNGRIKINTTDHSLLLTGDGGMTFTSQNGIVLNTTDTFGVTISNRIDYYNGDDNLEGNGMVSILKDVTLDNQTTSLGPTNLYTVPADGRFRVSMYLEATTAGTGGNLVSGFIDFISTSGNAQTRNIVPTLSLDTLGSADGSAFIDVNGGTTMTYSTVFTGAVGSPEYSVRIHVERL